MSDCKPECASRCKARLADWGIYQQCRVGHTSHACDCGASSTEPVASEPPRQPPGVTFEAPIDEEHPIVASETPEGGGADASYPDDDDPIANADPPLVDCGTFAKVERHGPTIMRNGVWAGARTGFLASPSPASVLEGRSEGENHANRNDEVPGLPENVPLRIGIPAPHASHTLAARMREEARSEREDLVRGASMTSVRLLEEGAAEIERLASPPPASPDVDLDEPINIVRSDSREPVQRVVVRVYPEVAKLREALRWYADPDVWRVPMQVEMANADDPPTSDAQADGGERARAALAETETKEADRG